MSFDPSFLSNTRDLRREREDEKAEAWLRARVVSRCYRWATFLLVVSMAAIGIPWLGLSALSWGIVAVVGAGMVILAGVMFYQRGYSSGIITLICALGVLPGWVYVAPHAFMAAIDFWEILSAQWRASLEKP